MLLLTIFTTYTEQTFRTECALLVNASPAVADILVDSLVCDFQSNPEHLFDWAFNGLGKQNDESKESFLIEYKSTSYDPETGKGNCHLFRKSTSGSLWGFIHCSFGLRQDHLYHGYECKVRMAFQYVHIKTFIQENNGMAYCALYREFEDIGRNAAKGIAYEILKKYFCIVETY